jgi:hypothetical protein
MTIETGSAGLGPAGMSVIGRQGVEADLALGPGKRSFVMTANLPEPIASCTR